MSLQRYNFGSTILLCQSATRAKKPCDKSNEPHAPVWDFEERKDLRRNLNEQPAKNCVGDRHSVNVAPLQLGEEVLWIHSARLEEALVTSRTLR